MSTATKSKVPSQKETKEKPKKKKFSVTKFLKKWTKKHHLPKTAQKEAAALLRKELKQYQTDVQKRSKSTALLRTGEAKFPCQAGVNSMSWMDTVQPGGLKSDSSSGSGSSDSSGSGSIVADTISKAARNKSIADSSLSSRSISEKDPSGAQLAGVLKSIFMDMNKGKELDTSKLTGRKLAYLSRGAQDQFDDVMKENTKLSLFLSLATKAESTMGPGQG